jgi:hypothetical protein
MESSIAVIQSVSKELYYFERVYKFIQRTYAVF